MEKENVKTEENKDVMAEKLMEAASAAFSEESVMAVVKEQMSKAVESAVNDAFKWGTVKDALDKKIKETMVPYIEEYDFSEFLPKLDTVLTGLLNSENCMAEKTMLENFKNLMTVPDVKEIKVTELFDMWIKMCEKNIDTTGLEAECDGERPYYKPVECVMDVEELDKPDWSVFRRARITFENEQDTSLNVEIMVSRFENGKENEENTYTISASDDVMLSSLRNLNEFEILLLRLQRAQIPIIIDEDYDNREIEPEEEPEMEVNYY